MTITALLSLDLSPRPRGSRYKVCTIYYQSTWMPKDLEHYLRFPREKNILQDQRPILYVHVIGKNIDYAYKKHTVLRINMILGA